MEETLQRQMEQSQEACGTFQLFCEFAMRGPFHRIRYFWGEVKFGKVMQRRPQNPDFEACKVIKGSNTFCRSVQAIAQRMDFSQVAILQTVPCPSK